MSDSRNFYFDQLVVDTDLDEIYTTLSAVERTSLAKTHGLASALATDDPNATRCGGIISGGVVTYDNVQSVLVTAVKARDQLGRLVKYAGTSYLSLTNIGDTPINPTMSPSNFARGDGASISSLIPGGSEAWLGIYLVYGEVLSDLREDGDGDPVYFNIAESFRFRFSLGAPATVPSLTRASLSDTGVLLADVLITDGGIIRLINPGGGSRAVICGSDLDFDYFNGGSGTGDYSSLHGRRGDWLSLSNANLPLSLAAGWPGRFGTPRNAIYYLAKQLQQTVSGAGDPAGSSLLGAPAVTGSLDATPPAEAANSLSAGSLTSQLVGLLTSINDRLGRGGGTIIPPAAADGLILNPTTMDADRQLLQIESMITGGTAAAVQQLRKPHGHLARAHEFFDDFMYVGKTTTGDLHDNHPGFPWGAIADGGGALGAGNGVFISPSDPGGVIILIAENTTGRMITWTTGYTPAAYRGGWWPLSTSCFMWRFRTPPSLTDQEFFVGLVNNYDVTNPFAIAKFGDSGANLQAIVKNTSAAGSPVTIGALSTGTNYTLRCWPGIVDSMWFQLNNDVPVEAHVSTGANSALGCDLVARVTAKNTTACLLYLDQAYASDMYLADDML